MAPLSALGFVSAAPRNVGDAPKIERVVVARPLHRVLAFTRRSIHDVVNDPIAKREVLGYYKLHRWVERGCEIVDLERQWNR
jgi:hypothetical protein